MSNKKPIIPAKIIRGSSSFAELRSKNYLYVDKSAFIYKWLNSSADSEYEGSLPQQVSLITRPRRFGKSTLLSMIASFFDITKKVRICLLIWILPKIIPYAADG